MTSRDMTDTSPIDTYLAALENRLTVEPVERATILEEIRGHLEETTAAEMARGSTAAEAESRAVATFGDVSSTARSINSALPIYWDWRRMAWGVILGALAIWIIWTLATFPFVVPMATEHQLDVSTSPASLLFTASPLGFGLFYTLRNGPWVALLILVLFGAIAFALGSRASSGWRAGLAFGLGVVVGMPFLPLSLVLAPPPVGSLSLLPIIVIIWLLTPYAIFAAQLGARVARNRDRQRMRVAAIATPRRRSVSRFAFASLVVLVALLDVNGWSLVRALTPATTASSPYVEQQLASAQANLPFTIRQPSYLPAGMTLNMAHAGVSDCNPCVGYTVAILEYRDSYDNWLTLTEEPSSLPSSTLTPSATPDFTVSSGTLTGYHQAWWLGAELRIEQQTMLAWNDGVLDYTMSTNMKLPTPVLEQIARSLSR
jgi:HAAS domain-containing protein